MDVDAVLFDLDGTLCTADQSGEQLYFGAFDRAGVEPFGRPEALWEALDYPPPPGGWRASLIAAFAKVAAAHGRTVDAEALAAGFQEVADPGAVSFRPGAREALASAREVGPVGLVTNGPERRQGPKLSTLGLEGRFDVTVFAGDAVERKPHPAPFRRALDALGVDASRAAYVGNSLEYDVAGAAAAGLVSVWCPDVDGTEPDGYRPDHVIEHVGDLGSVLRRGDRP